MQLLLLHHTVLSLMFAASNLGFESDRVTPFARLRPQLNRIVDFDELFLGNVDLDRQSRVLFVEV